MKTGFCTEMSLVLILNHIKRLALAEGEQVAFTMRKISDHCWVEMKTKDDIDIKMDAWANGLAILSEDGRFISDHKWNQNLFNCNKTSGKDFEEKTDNCYRAVIENRRRNTSELGRI